MEHLNNDAWRIKSMRHKILIADDEISIRTTLMRVFPECVVLLAEDGGTALRLIETERPSLVLLDLNMPVLGGLEVLLAYKEAKDPPLFIMLTGNEELEMAEKAMKMGAISYMTKPFELEVIREVVLSALGAAEGGEAEDRPWRVDKRGEAGGGV